MLTRTRRRALLALVPFAAVPLLVAATHGSGRHATTVSCGQTITASTTLSADIGPCGGDGVIIGANHVTLNLNGHQISGSAVGDGVSSSGTGATVQNGRITGFAFGILLEGSSSRIVNMRVGNATAFGIDVTGSNDLVSGNRVFANTGTGIIGNGPDNQYTNNILQGNGVDGLNIGDAASISGNKALSNGGSGIFFAATHAVTVTNNVTNGNHQDGVRQLTSADPTLATLSGNKASFNAQLGINAQPGSNDGGNNKADSNGTLEQCANVICS